MWNHNKDRYGASPHRNLDRQKGIVVFSNLWFVGLAAAVLVLLWAAGEHTTQVLQYRRSAIFAGEWWRLVTGHLVHAGFRHMALNVAGGLIMTALFLRTYSRAQWVLILVASVVAIDAGFLIRDRYLETYVGFSGVLHGVLAAGSLAWWRTESKLLAGAITAITIGKLIWEQLEGPVTLAGEGLTVIVNAHLYGALGGGIVAAMIVFSGGLARHGAKWETESPN